jgi:redox-sensitive bicupin YhaK (pirin superfamily)
MKPASRRGTSRSASRCSPRPTDDSFVLHSDAELLAATLTPGAKVEHAFRGGYGWLQVARGTVEVCGATLKAGDGLQLEAEKAIAVSSKDGGEFLLFDLD